MPETSVLRLGFVTDQSKTKLIGVKAPSVTLTNDDIKGAMDEIIASNVLSSGSGSLSGSKFARLVHTRTETVQLPE